MLRDAPAQSLAAKSALLKAFLAGSLVAGGGGCSLIASLDPPTTEGGGGEGGTAGAGGAAACETVVQCPAPASECETVTCDNGACNTTPVAEGTPTSTQTIGDCKSLQCDGAGSTVNVNDDEDVDDDGNACTDDTCSDGAPSNEPSAAGTPCGDGLECDGNGACVGCVTPLDCPGTDDDCQQRSCELGVCGVVFTAAGTATSTQVAGDCLEERCDGAGSVVSAVFDTDLPVDGQDCTDDLCDAGVASNPATMSGVGCDDGGGSVCDGTGDCVQCVVASTCPGVDTECQQRSCSAGVCGFTNTAAGTAITMQTPGDCKVVQCDGAGAALPIDLDTDLPVDGNPCTSDVCTAGVPSNPPGSLGMSCGASGVCDASGQCVGCLTANDCPDVDTECQTRTCISSTCGFSFSPAGTPLTMQTPGDCRVNQCNGAGAAVLAAQDSDLPVDGNQCTSDFCNAGIASNPPVGSGGSCSQNGGTVCNGSGSCVECLVATTCPGMDTDCQTRTCTLTVCGTANTPAGTLTSMQTPGDCQANQCNGSGGVVSVTLNADVPVDGVQCTSDVCTAGVPSNPPLAAGSGCNQMGGTVCNGASVCVQCITNADCALQTGGACSMNVCQAPTCSDNLQNGSETDTDCGGTCPDCALGDSCLVDGDCATGFCDGGTCALVNGCSLATAQDLTGLGTTTITFTSFTYAPKCVRVSAGTSVTFSGSFASHPLLGGVVAGSTVTPATSGPFVPATSTGTSQTFVMSSAGTFPYYCVPHATIGMNGVVFVVP
jgi:plastocyanin